MANRASDQITLVDLTDGVSVVLSSESYTFPGTTSAAIAGSTSTKVQAVMGDEYVAASVVLAEVTAPAGVTVTKDTNATAPTLTIAVASTVTSGGEVIIPVHVGDLTIEKRFSFQIAFKGATGQDGGVGAAAPSVQQGLDAITIATTLAGATTAASTITIPFAGYLGTTRAATTVAVGTLPSGVTVSTNTAATTSADGSLVLAVASGSTLGGTDNGDFTLTYTVAGGATFVRRFVWAKAKQGAGGATGAAALSADVRNEAFIVPTDNAGNTTAAQNITIPFAGYSGPNRAAATVALTGLPAGMTAGTNTPATTSADGTIIVAIASGSSLGGADNGSFTATVTTGGVAFPIVVSWSKSRQGAGGATGASATIMGLLNEAHAIPTDVNGAVLSAISIPVNFYAYTGTSRVAVTATVTGLPTGITVGTNTAGTTSADGVLTLNVAAGATLGGATAGTIDVSLTASGQTRVQKFSWAKAIQGASGITVEVVSSGGLVFKNAQVSTTLTARVYVGGTEVTGTGVTALGTIKWYKNGTYITGADGVTLVVAPGDVVDSATYEARLEN